MDLYISFVSNALSEENPIVYNSAIWHCRVGQLCRTKVLILIESSSLFGSKRRTEVYKNTLRLQTFLH